MRTEYSVLRTRIPYMPVLLTGKTGSVGRGATASTISTERSGKNRASGATNSGKFVHNIIRSFFTNNSISSLSIVVTVHCTARSDHRRADRMLCLRSTGHSLRMGTQFLLHGSNSVSVWRGSTSSTAEVRRTAKILGPWSTSSASRLFSAQKPGKISDQTSRFKKPEAFVVESQAGLAREKRVTEHTSSTTAASESVIANNSTANTCPGASAPPYHQVRSNVNAKAQIPPRRPVDTSSKEYKEAASRYVRFVVGLPFLLVTSYYLYQRREYLCQHEPQSCTDEKCAVQPQVRLRVVDSASPPEASNSKN